MLSRKILYSILLHIRILCLHFFLRKKFNAIFDHFGLNWRYSHMKMCKIIAVIKEQNHANGDGISHSQKNVQFHLAPK